jgi:hypothetical protein
MLRYSVFLGIWPWFLDTLVYLLCAVVGFDILGEQRRLMRQVGTWMHDQTEPRRSMGQD